MNQPIFVFFAQIEQLSESLDIFESLEKEGFYYYYFQKNKLYYIFLYGKSYLSYSFDNFLLSLPIIKELNTKKRKIRSIRGFILYALEIIQDEKLVTVLNTNFRPLFWNRVPDIIKQNKKNYLIEYLFKPSESILSSTPQESAEIAKILQNLQQTISSMNERILSLETTKPNNIIADKINIIDLEPTNSEVFKDSTENKIEKKTITQLTKSTLSAISYDAFESNQKHKILLKTYFEGTGKHTLYDKRGFTICYDSIRKNKTYIEASKNTMLLI